MIQFFWNLITGVLGSLIAALVLNAWPAFPTGYRWTAIVGFGLFVFVAFSFSKRDKFKNHKEKSSHNHSDLTMLNGLEIKKDLNVNDLKVSDNGKGKLDLLNRLKTGGNATFKGIRVKRSGK